MIVFFCPLLITVKGAHVNQFYSSLIWPHDILWCLLWTIQMITGKLQTGLDMCWPEQGDLKHTKKIKDFSVLCMWENLQNWWSIKYFLSSMYNQVSAIWVLFCTKVSNTWSLNSSLNSLVNFTSLPTSLIKTQFCFFTVLPQVKIYLSVVQSYLCVVLKLLWFQLFRQQLLLWVMEMTVSCAL